MTTEVERAYAAGVVDSDGSILIGKGNKQGYLQYSPMVIIYTQDPVSIDWFIERWTGHWVRSNGCYRVNYTTRLALAITQDIEPFLITKRVQAQLLTEYGTTITNVAGKPRGLGEAGWAKREELYLRMKELNSKVAKAFNVPEA